MRTVGTFGSSIVVVVVDRPRLVRSPLLSDLPISIDSCSLDAIAICADDDYCSGEMEKGCADDTLVSYCFQSGISLNTGSAASQSSQASISGLPSR